MLNVYSTFNYFVFDYISWVEVKHLFWEFPQFLSVYPMPFPTLHHSETLLQLDIAHLWDGDMT